MYRLPSTQAPGGAILKKFFGISIEIDIIDIHQLLKRRCIEPTNSAVRAADRRRHRTYRVGITAQVCTELSASVRIKSSKICHRNGSGLCAG